MLLHVCQFNVLLLNLCETAGNQNTEECFHVGIYLLSIEGHKCLNLEQLAQIY